MKKYSLKSRLLVEDAEEAKRYLDRNPNSSFQPSRLSLSDREFDRAEEEKREASREASRLRGEQRKEKALNKLNKRMWASAVDPKEADTTTEVTTKTLSNFKGQFGEVMTAVFFIAGLKFGHDKIEGKGELSEEVQLFCGSALRQIKYKWKHPTDPNKGAWQGALPIMAGYHLTRKATEEDVEAELATKKGDSIKKDFEENKGIRMILNVVVEESRQNANNFFVSLKATNGPKMPNGKTVAEYVEDNMVDYGFATRGADGVLQKTHPEALYKVIPNNKVSTWVSGGTSGSKDAEVFTPENGAILWPALGGSARNQADLVYMGVSLSVKVGSSAPGAINAGLADKLYDMETEIDDEHMAAVFGYVGPSAVADYHAAIEAGDIFQGENKEELMNPKNRRNRDLLKDISDRNTPSNPTAEELEDAEINIRESITLVVPELFESWGQAIAATWVAKSSEFDSVKLDPLGTPVTADDLPLGLVAKTENGTVTGTGGSSVSLEDIIGGLSMSIVGDGSVHLNPTRISLKNANGEFNNKWVWDNKKLVSFPRELTQADSWGVPGSADHEGKEDAMFGNLVGKSGAALVKNVLSNNPVLEKICKHIAKVASLGSSASSAQVAEEVLILSPTKKKAVRTSDYWQTFIDFWKIMEGVHSTYTGSPQDLLGYKQDKNTAWLYVKKPFTNKQGQTTNQWFKAFKATFRRSGTSAPISTIRTDFGGSKNLKPEKVQTGIENLSFSDERAGYQAYTDAELRAKQGENILLLQELDNAGKTALVKREFERVISLMSNPEGAINQQDIARQMNVTDQKRIQEVIDMITSHDAYFDKEAVMAIINKYKTNPKSVTEQEAKQLMDMLDGIYEVDEESFLYSPDQDPEGNVMMFKGAYPGEESTVGVPASQTSPSTEELTLDSYSIVGQLLSEQEEKLPEKIESLEDLMSVFEKALEVMGESTKVKYSIMSRLLGV